MISELYNVEFNPEAAFALRMATLRYLLWLYGLLKNLYSAIMQKTIEFCPSCSCKYTFILSAWKKKLNLLYRLLVWIHRVIRKKNRNYLVFYWLTHCTNIVKWTNVISTKKSYRCFCWFIAWIWLCFLWSSVSYALFVDFLWWKAETHPATTVITSKFCAFRLGLTDIYQPRSPRFDLKHLICWLLRQLASGSSTPFPRPVTFTHLTYAIIRSQLPTKKGALFFLCVPGNGFYVNIVLSLHVLQRASHTCLCIKCKYTCIDNE